MARSTGIGDLAARVARGAVGGVVGTMVMTAVMRRLHATLPREERYPLPPREITNVALGKGPGRAPAALAAHFAYGAATGALLAVASTKPSAFTGASYGLAVWGASYLGWIPAAGILTSAQRHPARRNLLMLAAHVAWGVGTAWSIRECRAAERHMLAGNAVPDAPGGGRTARTKPDSIYSAELAGSGRHKS